MPVGELLLQHLLDGLTGHRIMPEVIAELLKLIKDYHIAPCLAELPALVIDLLYVGFRSRRRNHLSCHGAQPFKPLLAHFFGQNCGRFTPKEGGGVCPTTTEIPSRWPNGPLRCGIEISSHQSGHKAAEGGPHFVRAGWKPFPNQGKDPCPHPGEQGRYLHSVNLSVESSLRRGLILPRDAKQIQRVHLPKADPFQPGWDLAPDVFRLLLLRKSRNNDTPFPNLTNRLFQLFRIHLQIDHLECLPSYLRN